MATVEQVMEALRNADKAGDTQAATRLAQIAQSMRSSSLNGPGENLMTGPQTPPPVEMQGQAHEQANRFGDVTGDLVSGPWDAAKAYGRGVVDQSQSPTMAAMPENWNPALKSFYARFGDAGMAALSAMGAGFAGAAGIAGEVVGGNKTREQKLASDLMMMGQVAVPELAGVSSVGRAAVSMPGKLEKIAQPTAKQAAARAADDLGITPSLGMTGKVGAMTAAGLEKVPLTGQIIARDAARAVGEVEGAFSRITGGLGKSLSPYEAGSSLQGGLRKFVDGFKSRATDLYNKIPIKSDAVVPASNTTAKIDDAMAVFSNNPEIAKKIGADAWAKVSAELKDKNISWQALKELRTKIGQAIGDTKGALVDTDTGKLKDLYGALTADMEAAAKSQGPEAHKAWQRANTFYKTGAKRIERSLDKTISVDNPERAFEAFTALAKADRQTADITRMRQIKSSMPRDDWNDVSASIVDRMGKAKPGAQNAAGDVFSPGSFLTEWNKMSSEAKNILLPSEVRVELDKLAKVAESVKSANLERNMSNTGTVAGLLATGAGGITNLPATVAALGAANISARGLTNVSFLRALNSAARGDAKVLSAMAKGKGQVAQDAATVLRLMAADTAISGSANKDNAPVRAIAK
jgi:hypothetical protein